MNSLVSQVQMYKYADSDVAHQPERAASIFEVYQRPIL